MPGDQVGAAGPDLLHGLDRRQRAAVTHGEGACLVVAGAGTGKTRVIARRIAWLVATRRARPAEILALTFTDRAADEMQARVDRLVPYGYVDTAISTFHAFGDRLVREFALELGLPTDLRVLGRADAVIFLREHLWELGLEQYLPLGDPTRFLDALVELFGRAKDEDLTPERLAAHAVELTARAARAAPGGADPGGEPPAGGDGGPGAALTHDAVVLGDEADRLSELAGAFERYQRLLARAGCIDFGDQLSLALRLVREHPAIRTRLRARYRYILVDEFQDTNPAQLELLAEFAGPGRNVMAVGDDDQSIYRFRGAALSNILDFRERFAPARVIVLRTNHRSQPPILEAAYRLIRHNDPVRLEVRDGFDKRPVARRRSRKAQPVRHHGFPTTAQEADWVAADIAGRLAAGVRPEQVAVLVRSNGDADPFLRSLNLAGVPWRFSGASGLYARPEVRALLAFLRAVANPESTVDLYGVATAEPYNLGGEALTSLLERARRRHLPLWQLLADADAGATGATAATRATVGRLLGDLRAAVELSHRRPAGEVLYDFLRRSGRLAALARAGTAEADAALQNVARFFEVIRRQCALLTDPRVPFLVPHLEALVEAGDDPLGAEPLDEAGAVAVLTVHKAKGLEFRVVYLVGLADGRFPIHGRREGLRLPPELCRDTTLLHLPESGLGSGLAEERRLFYVAMTRARDELILTHGTDGGGRRARRPSPFVAEALDLVDAPAARPAGARSGGAAAACGTTVPSGAGEPLGRIEACGVAEAPPVAAPGRAVDRRDLLSLSYSQVDDYLSCPLRYRYRHVLGLPSPPHHALSYGIAMHQAVAAFGRSQMAGAPLSEPDLLAAFTGAWTGEGFLSREHEEARLGSGRTALRRFRDAQLASGAPPPLAVERDFIVALPGVRLRGRFDRLEDDPAGPVITDFKSSDVRDPARARQRARESLQLSVYALAHRAASGRLPAALQLVFLDSGVTGRVAADEARLARAGERIQAAATGIVAGAFEARPDAVGCGYCPFRTICPSAAV